ncbi:hypothetical protein T439DRAFT_379800 [Meredithblackwellia eburnea MCA 4105]
MTMLQFLASTSSSLSVSIENPVVFTSPGAADHLHEAEEPVLRGSVKLSLPHNRRVSKLKVTLTGTCECFAGPGGWSKETSNTIVRTLDLDFHDEELAQGEHTFGWNFTIPSSTAASGGSPFGKTTHQVSATLEFSTGFINHLSSNHERFWIVPLQTDPGDVPNSFEMTHEHQSDSLGPLRISLFSPHLTIGALLNLRLFVGAPPSSLTVVSVRAYLTEYFTVAYEDSQRPQVQQPRVSALTHINDNSSTPTLSSVDYVNKRLGEGRDWTYTSIFRMPDCTSARPTTLSGGDAKITVSHKLSVEVRFRLSGSKSLKETNITFPVTVGSCVSMIDSLLLPQYAKRPPPTQVRHSECGTLCMCEYGLGETLEKYREILKLGGEAAPTSSDQTSISSGYRSKEGSPCSF